MASTVSYEVLPNQPPVADAGADRWQVTGSTIYLDGRASSDFERKPLTYKWTQVGGPATGLLNPTEAVAIAKAPGSSTVLTYRLVVRDEHGAARYDEVVVTVS